MSWVRASPVAAAVAAARTRLSEGAVELACHAAVPVAVDAGLLHLLRINFFLDPPSVLPFEAEATLLLSPLFREVGEDLYEIDPALRDALLAALVARFGPERPGRVAVLLEQYTDQHPTWHTQPELEHAQRLTALNLVDPARAADWLAANRAAAGGPALTREWFVAMSGRLRPRASLRERLDAVLLADGPAAVAELGELALLPGADVRTIAVALEHASRGGDPAVRALALDILDTVRRLIPPPPPRATVEETTGSFPATPFPVLHDLDPPAFDPVAVWPLPGGLTVPIGSDPDGRPVLLDLLDPGQGGTGPHGLIVGATGSGKSELLRTIILGLAVRNSPSALTILPVSYLGRDTFAGLESLPHLAGVATGLAEAESLLDRFAQVVAGEIERRQEQSTRRFPRLFIVVDEFTELLTADPSVIDTLIGVGRAGRALGIHLLLACQRLDEGRLRGLETYLSFRIALRTSSAAESRVVLGDGAPDASELPRAPGHGYLRSGSDGTVRRFRAAPVSVPYPTPPPSWEAVLDPFGPRGETLLDVLLARMAGHGDPVHHLWLPPLPAEVALGDLPAIGVTIGEIDVPREHQIRDYSIDLTGDSGHVAIVGARGTGKTTALLTVVTAIARAALPVSVHCVGGGLAGLARLPQVAEVLEPDDDAAVTRLLAALPRVAPAAAVLVVDGWSALVRRHPAVDGLLSAGRAVIVAADDDWGPLDDPAFGTRIELRLAGQAKSRVSLTAARRLRDGGPGRALVADGLQLQIALPVRHVGGSHDGYVRELSRPDRRYPVVRLGTFEDDGAEFVADFSEDPHLLVVGGLPEDRLAVRQAIERTVSGEVVGPEDAPRVAEELRRSSGVRTKGPELWVLASDDLGALSALREFFVHGWYLRLHVVVFAESYGSDPVVAELASLAVPIVVLSGEPAGRGTGELLMAGRPAQRFRLDPPGPDPSPPRGVGLSPLDPAWGGPGGLTVPIGVDPDGAPVMLDLRDSSEGGTGPHGIVIGATGSGRTDLLRALIARLAATNDPAELNILAVDLHSGDGFAGLESLPHLAGLAAGTGDEPARIERFEQVMAAEIARRRAAGPHPRLLVVIDKFSEFHHAHRSVVDTLITIGRVGRVLGIHLLLSTQRLRDGQLLGLQTYLTYRIAMRTFTPTESRTVLDSEAAFSLPHEPGAGYLRSKRDDTLRRFQAVPVPSVSLPGQYEPVRQLWPPPLPSVVALGDLPAGGVTIGLSGRGPFAIDLSGHVAVVGERGSGTTTALQTLITALARQSTPYHVYCLGGGLNTVAGLPFVGGVFHRDDRDAVARLIAFLLRRRSDALPRVVLVVDGWARVLREHPDLDRLVFGGRAVIVATATSWEEFPASHRGTFSTVVELRLADPATSRFAARDAERLRQAGPGRGLAGDATLLQIALPTREVPPPAQQISGPHHAYVAELASGWTGPPAPRVAPDLRFRLGVYEDDRTECALDFAHEPHLLIHGSGNAARHVLAAVSRWADGTVFGPADVAEVAALLRARLPGPDVPQWRLQTRSWWTGPELWVIATDRPGALDPLVDFVPRGVELGFHLVVADDVSITKPTAAVLRLLASSTPTLNTTVGISPAPAQVSITRGGRQRPVRLDGFPS